MLGLGRAAFRVEVCMMSGMCKGFGCRPIETWPPVRRLPPFRIKCQSKQGGVGRLRPGDSDVNLFCYCGRIVDLDPEVSESALRLASCPCADR